ncbi:hypothetical protein Q5752_002359 [Cryptotrichosporon argae]
MRLSAPDPRAHALPPPLPPRRYGKTAADAIDLTLSESEEEEEEELEEYGMEVWDRDGWEPFEPFEGFLRLPSPAHSLNLPGPSEAPHATPAKLRSPRAARKSQPASQSSRKAQPVAPARMTVTALAPASAPAASPAAISQAVSLGCNDTEDLDELQSIADDEPIDHDLVSNDDVDLRSPETAVDRESAEPVAAETPPVTMVPDLEKVVLPDMPTSSQSHLPTPPQQSRSPSLEAAPLSTGLDVSALPAIVPSILDRLPDLDALYDGGDQRDVLRMQEAMLAARLQATDVQKFVWMCFNRFGQERGEYALMVPRTRQAYLKNWLDEYGAIMLDVNGDEEVIEVFKILARRRAISFADRGWTCRYWRELVAARPRPTPSALHAREDAMMAVQNDH